MASGARLVFLAQTRLLIPRPSGVGLLDFRLELSSSTTTTTNTDTYSLPQLLLQPQFRLPPPLLQATTTNTITYNLPAQLPLLYLHSSKYPSAEQKKRGARQGPPRVSPHTKQQRICIRPNTHQPNKMRDPARGQRECHPTQSSNISTFDQIPIRRKYFLRTLPNT